MPRPKALTHSLLPAAILEIVLWEGHVVTKLDRQTKLETILTLGQADQTWNYFDTWKGRPNLKLFWHLDRQTKLETILTLGKADQTWNYFDTCSVFPSGIVKTHNLAFIECETLQAVFSKDMCPNSLTSSSK